jgi:hypothetical protein
MFMAPGAKYCQARSYEDAQHLQERGHRPSRYNVYLALFEPISDPKITLPSDNQDVAIY